MRRILVALCSLGLVLAGQVPAEAATGANYLALGDSVAFGTNPNKDPNNAPSFHGYPDFVSNGIRVADVNASCPGEATGGFISPTGLDNVCRPYKAAFPLHVDYPGQTQLQFAEGFLRSNPNTQLITIDLGANDIFKLQKICATTVNPTTCVNSQIGTFLSNMDMNLRFIFASLRTAGYHGPIVALTYYALAYKDPTSVAGANALNSVMKDAAAHSTNVWIADGFTAFQAISIEKGGPTADSCVAGLRLVNNSTGRCDVHPTILGHQLLAQAVLDAVDTACRTMPSDCINPRNNI